MQPVLNLLARHHSGLLLDWLMLSRMRRQSTSYCHAERSEASALQVFSEQTLHFVQGDSQGDSLMFRVAQ